MRGISEETADLLSPTNHDPYAILILFYGVLENVDYAVEIYATTPIDSRNAIEQLLNERRALSNVHLG